MENTLLKDANNLQKDANRLNILLVDDDDGDSIAVTRAFRKAKILNPITRAVDGIQAWEILEGKNGHEKLPKPHVLLVDLNMPRMNGIQFVESLRANPEFKQALVFMLTTSKSDQDISSAYALNVAGYIVKETAGADFMQLVALLDCFWRIVEIP